MKIERRLKKIKKSYLEIKPSQNFIETGLIDLMARIDKETQEKIQIQRFPKRYAFILSSIAILIIVGTGTVLATKSFNQDTNSALSKIKQLPQEVENSLFRANDLKINTQIPNLSKTRKNTASESSEKSTDSEMSKTNNKPREDSQNQQKTSPSVIPKEDKQKNEPNSGNKADNNSHTVLDDHNKDDKGKDKNQDTVNNAESLIPIKLDNNMNPLKYK